MLQPVPTTVGNFPMHRTSHLKDIKVFDEHMFTAELHMSKIKQWNWIPVEEWKMPPRIMYRLH